MATTDSSLAFQTLEILRSAVPRSALLHGGERLRSRQLGSDLDVAIGGLSRDWHVGFCRGLERVGLSPLIVWPYDDGAATVFLAAQGLLEGVQLDLLYSPSGRGTYGFRTDVATAGLTTAETFNLVSPVDQWLYEVQKRWMKRQSQRLASLLAHPPTARPELIERASQLFVAANAMSVRHLIDGIPLQPPTRHRIAEFPRLARRLVTPSGLWVHARGGNDMSAHALEQRLSRFIPATSCFAWPPSDGARRRLSGMRKIAGNRWRAGIAITYGTSRSAADVEVSSDLECAAEELRSFASARAIKHLARLQWRTTC